ncbi:flavin reductase family protein [Kitasatospora sp. NBC_01287]|uniref:flavin reductase family protein n=1 Tax=Kitasatospora sp. NBC_01287 TaxID=2903573 RepID=UPI002252DB23|nr:flavin reductase family protein [Kitasatospora sp. NBC_01287]MCX4751044.1 flavin reductase family protein [Kitasatospora sp. NBC_01287]
MEQFDSFSSLLDYPVYVVTAAVGEERAGCLVGFAGQCSLQPPRFTVWISKANRTYAVASRSRVLAVHLLPARRHDLAELFGGRTGDEVDKFAATAWEPGPGGVPVLAGAMAWFVGRVLDRADWGDHVGFLLDPLDTVTTLHGRALTFHDVKDIDAGHAA